MKSVLISIRPQWVEKIASGEKTIEVRKSRPKLETPFKCFIYETQGATETPWADEDGHLIFKGRGVVVGEFICDRITKYPHEHYTDGEHLIPYDDFEQIGMDGIELYDYLRVNDGYGWHISDLKIYDKPKQLREFRQRCKYFFDKGIQGCITGDKDIIECGYNDFADCLCNGLKPLTRPPQSWCYVEEL